MAQSPDKFLSNNKVTFYDFDPDDADANDVAWVDMQNYENFTIVFIRTIGTGALDTFKILANAASDGSGTDVTVATHAVASEPNAVGDYIFLECTADMVAQEAADASVANARYVTASVEFATSTDEGVVGYILSNPKRAHDASSADNIA